MGHNRRDFGTQNDIDYEPMKRDLSVVVLFGLTVNVKVHRHTLWVNIRERPTAECQKPKTINLPGRLNEWLNY